MKYEDMNARQKKAFRNILYAARFTIGGLENTLADNAEDSEEYQNAKAALADHEGLVSEIYYEATHSIYGDGFVQFNQEASSFMKDIRFCGKDWLMERVERRVRKMGY